MEVEVGGGGGTYVVLSTTKILKNEEKFKNVRKIVEQGPLKIVCSTEEIIMLENIFRISFQNSEN